MRPCTLEISTSALLHNLAIAKQHAPSAQVVGMVKANAYGHGLIEVGRVLAPHVAYLGVACLEEALQLRSAGIDIPILLMEGFFSRDELAEIAHHSLAFVIHQPEQLRTLLLQGQRYQHPFEVWLKYDSGMHRLGFDKAQFLEAIQQLLACPWVHHELRLMSHFSCADVPNDKRTTEQLTRFFSVVAAYPSYPRSLANSAAILSYPDSHQHYIRPGLMLYGASPLVNVTSKALGLKAVMAFKSKVIALRQCQQGEQVGYGGAWQAKRSSVIATVAAGYGDGYPRHICDESYVLIDHVRCRIVGRVSMDMLTVDVTHLAETYIGQEVILWGDDLPIEEVSRFAHTLSYDLLCRASMRATRRVVF